MSEAQHTKGLRLLDYISRYALYTLVFLIPLAFFPWTVDKLELNKQTILLIVSSILVISWLAGMIVKRAFTLRPSSAFIPALIFGVSVLASAFFSKASYMSFIGQVGQEYTSFLTVLALILTFFVASHLLSVKSTFHSAVQLSLGASALIGLHILLGMLGLAVFSTNFIGAPNSLAMYLLTMAVLGSGFWVIAREGMEGVYSGKTGVVARVATVITAVSALFVMLSLDYFVLWIAAIIGTGVLFLFAFIRAEEFPHPSRFVLPMTVFVLSLIFLFMPTFIPRKFALEIAPSYKASLQISREAMQDSSWITGTGPGTFAFAYTKFKPLEINQTRLWDIRFDRAGSHLLTVLTTLGLFGFIAFIAVLITLLVIALHTLFQNRSTENWKHMLVIFSAWSVLAFATIMYSSNLTLSFTFWLLSALLVSQSAANVKTYEFSRSPRIGLLTAFVFVLVNVGLLTVVFVSASRYAAEVTFAKAVKLDRAGASVDEVIVRLDRSARMNKLSDVYYRNLANALLVKTADRLKDETASKEELTALISTSVNAAKRAVQIDPISAVNMALLGDIYRELSAIAGDTNVFAIEAYQRAIELAPNNPKYYTALGRAHILRSDMLGMLMASEDEAIKADATEKRAAEIELAITALTTASELLPQYAPAHYQLSLAYERQGKLAEAATRMETVRQSAPNDVGVALQLGLLYAKLDRFDDSRKELERAIVIAPNFANARWYLADVYAQLKMTDKAIEQLEYILPQNEGNKLLLERIQKLRAGQVTEPVPVPLEEGVDAATDAPAEEPVVVEE